MRFTAGHTRAQWPMIDIIAPESKKDAYNVCSDVILYMHNAQGQLEVRSSLVPRRGAHHRGRGVDHRVALRIPTQGHARMGTQATILATATCALQEQNKSPPPPCGGEQQESDF
jgi:hypothetical protein